MKKQRIKSKTSSICNKICSKNNQLKIEIENLSVNKYDFKIRKKNFNYRFWISSNKINWKKYEN